MKRILLFISFSFNGVLVFCIQRGNISDKFDGNTFFIQKIDNQEVVQRGTPITLESFAINMVLLNNNCHVVK